MNDRYTIIVAPRPAPVAIDGLAELARRVLPRRTEGANAPAVSLRRPDGDGEVEIMDAGHLEHRANGEVALILVG